MKALQPIRANPNAATAGTSTGVGVLVVWLLGYLGVDISAEVGVLIAGALTTFVLAFARYGLLGLWARFLRGDAHS